MIKEASFSNSPLVQVSNCCRCKTTRGCFLHLTVSSLRYCPRLVKPHGCECARNIHYDAKPSARVSTHSNPAGHSSGATHAFARDFISQFLQSVSQLLKQGLRSDYVSEQGNLAFMKGKLMLSAQLRHNAVNRHKFCVDYDEYMPDCAANRLLHSTLDKLLSLKLSSENQRWLYELCFAFDGIPLSRDIESDMNSLRIERGMTHYSEPMAWAQLILRGMSPSALQGNTKAISLLFPMEAVFESFVAQTLPYELPSHLKVFPQAATYSLVKHGIKDCFKLRPDLLIQSRQPIQTKMVMDTKWKQVNSSQQKITLWTSAIRLLSNVCLRPKIPWRNGRNVPDLPCA